MTGAHVSTTNESRRALELETWPDFWLTAEDRRVLRATQIQTLSRKLNTPMPEFPRVRPQHTPGQTNARTPAKLIAALTLTTVTVSLSVTALWLFVAILAG